MILAASKTSLQFYDWITFNPDDYGRFSRDVNADAVNLPQPLVEQHTIDARIVKEQPTRLLMLAWRHIVSSAERGPLAKGSLARWTSLTRNHLASSTSRVKGELHG